MITSGVVEVFAEVKYSSLEAFLCVEVDYSEVASYKVTDWLINGFPEIS